MCLSLQSQIHILVTYICPIVYSFDVVRFYPVLDFTKTGSLKELDCKGLSSNQAGCVGSCLLEGNCIGFAYSPNLKKCVKSYTVGDLDKLSDGHWTTFYCKF